MSKHDHIVNIQGVCEHDDSVYLLFEFCALGSIDEFLRQNSNTGYYDIDKLTTWCVQVADGMDFLTKENIIHVRFLKYVLIYLVQKTINFIIPRHKRILKGSMFISLGFC